MQHHQELTNEQFEQQFSDCTLDPTVFSHEAHLRLAWIHITKYGVEKAITNIRDQIKNFVKALNAEDKYHETVTIAGIKAVHHFIQHSKTDTFSEFIAENSQLLTDFKGLLSSHYTTDIFQSQEAKEQFIEADLLPFD